MFCKTVLLADNAGEFDTKLGAAVEDGVAEASSDDWD